MGKYMGMLSKLAIPYSFQSNTNSYKCTELVFILMYKRRYHIEVHLNQLFTPITHIIFFVLIYNQFRNRSLAVESDN